MKEKTVLVTGGNGFVGQYVCRQLMEMGNRVRVPTRTLMQSRNHACEFVPTGDLTTFANWRQLVRDVDAVVHLVARTHVTDEFGAAAMQKYRAVNVDVTRRLAKAALDVGVKHFVYLSSIKAVGNESNEPLTEIHPCNPVDSYGITKLEAEQNIQDVLGNSDVGYTILRPPLVYGVGVKGNFLRLLNLVQRGMPLPRITNRRSMVHVSNLVDIVCLALTNERARDQIFHVADAQPVSTAELVSHIAAGMGRGSRLMPVPQNLLTQLGRAIGKQEEMRRLVDSLCVSIEKVTTELNWTPPVSIADGVRRTSTHFAANPWTVAKPDSTKKTSTAKAA